MGASKSTRIVAVGVAIIGILGLGGCAIDVDLTSTPSAVPYGGTVDFDISVRNRTTCPVGGVVALLIPFIPQDLLISQIPDPEVREQLSQLVDIFCSGGDSELPDGAGGCRIEDGEIFCELTLQAPLAGPVAQAAVTLPDNEDGISCSVDGDKLTCRFPRRIVELAMSQQESGESLGALQCVSGSNIAACGALLLDPNESKSASVEMTANRPGALRNWIVSFATVRGGVCTAGLLRRRPCNDDSDCTGGVNNSCGAGICENGTDAGFGCDVDGDCAGGGTCVLCDIAQDGQILSGVACTETASTLDAAPVASGWGLVAMVATLSAVGAVTLRRLRRA